MTLTHATQVIPVTPVYKLRLLRLLKPKGKLGEDADEEKIRAAWNRTTQQGSGLPARELGTQKSWKSKGQRS